MAAILSIGETANLKAVYLFPKPFIFSKNWLPKVHRTNTPIVFQRFLSQMLYQPKHLVHLVGIHFHVACNYQGHLGIVR